MAKSQYPDRISLLAQKWQEGNITPEEKKEFDEWYHNTENTFEINNGETFDEMQERLYNSILAKGNIKQNKTRQLWPRIAAAASILFIISIGVYFLTRNRPLQQVDNTQVYAILPGSNKAVLTLANGNKINLTDIKNGIIANESGVIIRKSNDGKISYEISPLAKQNRTIAYNTISTPRGGQWPVVILPDGTKVVLDASSSIKYPVIFNGRNRKVEITGQAYFEVVHNSAHPFKVIAGNQVIEDIGTQFNVNSYNDEPVMSTTLLEGAVKITVANKSTMLKPGQRATVNKRSSIVSVTKVNAEDMVDWKNGQISFKNKNIQEIMRQVSRWYDVDVEYNGVMPERTFTGGISRKASLADLLKILEFNNIHCQIKGKKIIVSNT